MARLRPRRRPHRRPQGTSKHANTRNGAQSQRRRLAFISQAPPRGGCTRPPSPRDILETAACPLHCRHTSQRRAVSRQSSAVSRHRQSAAMSRSLPSLGLLVMLAFLTQTQWCVEGRAFFGSLLDAFQDASLNNGTALGGGGFGLLLEALSSLHGGSSFSDRE
ncbi:hypothetical protein MSG28_015833 [Choristoneura fumiferana]|uniref:Uncharacterized protein n=1 Tax=Choristoneura fumiferana TaxID=7141 RepID=A0ACC0KCC5_CHOFU|nr:hypothetical protein MSG28_015833 [Choristoneura fumiferana]